MGHYLHAWLVGQSILNALVAWRQILSYNLCRFVAWKGNRVLHSENGSNFVGAQKELEKAYKEMDQKITAD